MDKQIKSKKRVSDHGEVFTNQREVNAMLDLVISETERIESRFLEPACGNGNFLAEVLRRKLAVCRARYGKYPNDYEKFSFLAISSIYGVDILEDNAQECRERLYNIWNDEYTKICKNSCSNHCREAIRYVLKNNILNGDALTMKQSSGEPIIFAQWDFTIGNLVKRKDYRLDELLEGQEKQKGDVEVLSLFGDDSFEHPKDWVYDEETKGYVPGPIKEYAPVDYRRVQEGK